MQELLRQLPKVDEMLNHPKVSQHLDTMGHPMVVRAIRRSIDQIRQEILANQKVDDVAAAVYRCYEETIVASNQASLRRVLNGTGVILHTNLGRARLAEAARKQVESVASSYSTLEYNLAERSRGSRYDHVTDLLVEITGAEDALVVNNNAAAVLLALNTLAAGRESIVSRGQLIEIGGSFRIPAVMEQSGSRLCEVGTTNKTHLTDYQQAITDETALLMKVHTSNYRIIGFTEEVSTAELVKLGNQYNIPVLDDLGSGMLYDTSKFGLSYEPTVQEVVQTGVDVVTFSGDKLLGGPQAGIIVGKKKYIEAMKSNHLNRALRIDKLTLAALEATLRLYLDEEKALQEIPTLRMLSLTKEELRERSEHLASRLRLALGDLAMVDVVATIGQVGGGALPTEEVPAYGVSIKPVQYSVNQYETLLRQASTPLIARIEDDGLLINLRTIAPNEEDELIQICLEVLQGEM